VPVRILAMRSLPKITPQLCAAVHEPPTGSGWVHEIKHDGHRLIAYLARGTARLITRNGNNAIGDLPHWLL
jgi:bifunctional non-homologous end joining protein LigD